MSNLTINSKVRNYDIYFDHNIKKAINKNYKKNDIIIIDKKVYDLLNGQIIFKNKKILKIKISENAKDYNNIGKIINNILSLQFTKSNKLIVVGGGITQDISSFIAHILFRGIEWIFIPTTLLAQADSCIGSKISVNFNKYKNLLGSYYPPSKIYIDTKLLKSLNKIEIFSGIGEMSHYFIVSSKRNFLNFKKNVDFLMKRDLNILKIYIKKCLEIKKDFIEKDEFEKNIRIFLNYGHTFGHALEGYLNYKIPHGIAVSHGINIANFISLKLKLISLKKFNEIYELTSKINKKYKIKDINTLKYYKFILKDKKTINKNIRIILINDIGIPLVKTFKKNNILIKYLDEYFRIYNR